MLGNEGYWKAQQHIQQARRKGERTLDIRGLKLRELPEAIASLTELQQLYLSNNQLTELPEAIRSLSQLRVLYLSHNKLTELPEAIASLTKLRQLDLKNNPLNPDLAAAYEQGTQAVLQYLRAKAQAQITLNEAKLILIVKARWARVVCWAHCARMNG